MVMVNRSCLADAKDRKSSEELVSLYDEAVRRSDGLEGQAGRCDHCEPLVLAREWPFASRLLAGLSIDSIPPDEKRIRIHLQTIRLATAEVAYGQAAHVNIYRYWLRQGVV